MLFPSGSNGKLIFVLQVFALRAVLEEQINLVNQGITVIVLFDSINQFFVDSFKNNLFIPSTIFIIFKEHSSSSVIHCAVKVTV
jgi:hypothetical protein